jgi:hypothetical protein
MIQDFRVSFLSSNPPLAGGKPLRTISSQPLSVLAFGDGIYLGLRAGGAQQSLTKRSKMCFRCSWSTVRKR